MTGKSMVKTVLMVFSLTILFNLGVYAQKTDCSKTTDAEVVKAIYDKIKVKYANQIIHINVRIKDGIVTLEGWARDKGVRKEIGKYAKKTSCVKNVVNKLTLAVTGGCNPGQQRCGDICIDKNETCNIVVVEN